MHTGEIDMTSPLVLIKISEKKFLEETINKGRIYMNPVSFYRKYALEGWNPIIYDKDEALYSLLKKDFLEIDGSCVQIHGEETTSRMFVSGNQCLYCLYGIHQNLHKIDDETYKHTIPKEVIPYLFLKKVDNALKARRTPGAAGFVAYDDHKYEINRSKTKMYDSIEACFHKRQFYSKQSKYRIVALNNEDVPITDLYIGALEKDEYSPLINIEPNKDFEILLKVNCREKLSESKSIISINEITTCFV